MPNGIIMSYLDSTDARNHTHCFSGELVRPQIIDDAQFLDKVAEASFDFLVVNHVLEHMHDFFVVRLKSGFAQCVQVDWSYLRYLVLAIFIGRLVKD